MRAPGMTLMKMPVFTWMSLVTQFLLLFAIPVITVALFLLMFDRLFGANFFNVDQGADPLLWEHLFWIFGHPEVYILILPAFGIVSEIIPVFSRKPIFGYPFMVFSGIAIGFMGWGVWAHHMFASGIGPISVAAFSVSTMFIAVPTGVKILNWMATMWGGKLKFIAADALLDRPGRDVHHRRPLGRDPRRRPGRHPADRHLLHRRPLPLRALRRRPVRLLRRLLLLVAEGVRLRAERARSARCNFWITAASGFNLTFGPMHILGLQGMPRRIYTYRDGYGFNFWNMVTTIGAFIIAVSMLIFFLNILRSRRKARAAKPGRAPGPTRGTPAASSG